MGKETNFSYMKNVARADAICINSIEDLIAYTIRIDNDNRQLFPMQHYWINQSLEVPFSIIKFGQNEMFSDTILAEDWVYTGTDTAFKNDLYLTEAIASFSSENAGAATRVNLTNMHVAWKQAIEITGTANYNGVYTVPFGTDRKTGDTSFIIDVAFSGTEAGTATVVNAQFVIQRLNVYFDSGTLLNIVEQDTLYIIDSYIQGDTWGVAGALDLRIRDNLVGSIVHGLIMCDCGNDFEVSGNTITTSVAGNEYVFDLDSHDPQFSAIKVFRNTLFLQSTDNFIIATTETHKNLTPTGYAIIEKNVSENLLTYSVKNITKNDYLWSFNKNNTQFNFKDSQRIGEFHVITNVKPTAIGALNTWYNLDLNASILSAAANEGFELTDTIAGILTYKAPDKAVGTCFCCISCETGTAVSKNYQMRVLKNGSIHVEGMSMTAEVLNVAKAISMVIPVEIEYNNTIQLQIRQISGSVTNITITNMVFMFRG